MTDGIDSEGTKPTHEYEIGYGRPPKKTQFKPGESGNPKGGKRSTKSVQGQMQKVLLKKVPINEGGRTILLPLQEVILRNLALKAAKGDLKAVAFTFKLLSSSEYAETDAIDQNVLSPDDQAMFAEIMRQFTGPGSPSQSSQFGSVVEPSSGIEVSGETEGAGSKSENSVAEDDFDDE